jgi:acetylornithine deacetylase
VKWLGRDAIKGLRQLLGELDAMENHFSRMESNELFADYPLQRPITVDRVSGGEWQGMICDHVLCAGYFELCPGDDLDVWQERFTNELKDRLAGQGWPREAIDVDFSERYSGFSTTTTSSICRAAEMMIRYSAASGRWKKWRGFNSGCEGGLRFALHGTPTLVWGPGSLAQAHRVDEYVPVQDVMDCSNAMAAVALAYLDIEAGADIVSRAGN